MAISFNQHRKWYISVTSGLLLSNDIQFALQYCVAEYKRLVVYLSCIKMNSLYGYKNHICSIQVYTLCIIEKVQNRVGKVRYNDSEVWVRMEIFDIVN